MPPPPQSRPNRAPAHNVDLERLRAIKSFPQLVKYLRDDLDWPIESDADEDLTFTYSADELGLDAKSAVKIKEIKQLRPLASDQPWGIFFVNFEPKKLPVVVLRRILRSLVLNKRGHAKKTDRAAWDRHDLLFISAYGEGDDRAITFAHFADPPPGHDTDLPTLKVLGWDDDDTPLHLDKVDRDLREHLRWPADGGGAAGVVEPIAWRKWAKAFTLAHGEVVRTSKDLAVRLAELAGRIRKRARTVLNHESDKGPLKTLHKAFREALIHDLTEDDFADMYAQTIAYGLLTAAVSRHSSDAPGVPVSADSAVEMVPVTNPFLKEMLERFMKAGGRNGHAAKSPSRGIDFDELGVSEVVDLLRTANMDAVLRDFGNRNPLEDPVIHFYELFLKEYDPKKRMQRGVFYTPRPVVSFIVRSVHEILQKEFGLADGLADTTTWGEMLRKHPGLKLPTRMVEKKGVKDPVAEPAVKPEDPFVLILDPATGTGTFLVETIEVIHKHMVAKWRNQDHSQHEIDSVLWQTYVAKDLLPRLHGYELMPAPYAIAHMKIGLKLHETGYRFGSEERVRVYLTNALEPAQDFSDRLEFDVPALAHEARAVNAVKRGRRFTVVIGNPPYSNFGRLNRIPFILELLEEYKKDLNEKKINLDDDFIKFVRFAQYLLGQTGVGLLGVITNNVYLDGLTHRRMRHSLLQSFPHGSVVDLHGSIQKQETAPDGTIDENVFDIKQGVAIALMARMPGVGPARMNVADVQGDRKSKYERLLRGPRDAVNFRALVPTPPMFFFAEKDNANRAEYERGWSIPTVMPFFNSGIQTKKDSIAIQFTRSDINEVIENLRTRDLKWLRSHYELEDESGGWSIERARDDVRQNPGQVIRVQYRPFDVRFTYFTGKASGFLARPRSDITAALQKTNVALVTMRQIAGVPDEIEVFASAATMTDRSMASTLGTPYLFPLYRPSEENLLSPGRVPNLADGFLMALAKALGCRINRQSGLPEGVSAEGVFQYIYALLHSPQYRKRFAPLLKLDFPRVLLPTSPALFDALAKLGAELVEMHLLQSSGTRGSAGSYAGTRNPTVETTSHADNTVWLDKSQTQGFRGISESVWNFRIGGYQVCEKWLKDRKGRTLSKDDIEHYQKIIVALSETIRIMGEIDKVIDAHGGWPGAFVTEKSNA